jgi:hypothetical protein
MGLDFGGVSEVTRTPQGGWMMTPFAPLQLFETVCDYPVVRITRDGQVLDVE